MMQKKQQTRWQGIIILLLLLLFFLKDKIFGSLCACPGEPKTKFLSAVISEPSFENSTDEVTIDVEAFERSEDQNLITEPNVDFTNVFNASKDSLTIRKTIYG